MATVFLGHRWIAYDRLSASWKDSYWSVLRRTKLQVTQRHEAETLTKIVTQEFDFFVTMHQRTSHWLLSKLSATATLFN